MKFVKFAEYLERLTNTASRNEMTVILSELFAESDKQDVKEITYLLMGNLGPAYRSPNFGMADKQLLKALGDQAMEAYKRLGDMGLVAEEIQSLRPKVQSDLKCGEVYKMLWEIAMVEGEGSVEGKMNLVRKLINKMSPLEAKYAVKIILSKLRTGFSDMTILDSLSWSLSGNKSLREVIENQYNIRADLGEIAFIVKDLGFKISELHIQPEIGTPILMAKAERAVSSEEIWERNGACALEYKLDGLRIQAHVNIKSRIGNRESKQVTLFSRGLEDVTSMYPDVVQGLMDQINEECVIEGEMIAVRPDGSFLPFQETMQRKRKYDITEMAVKIPLKLFVFDILVVGEKGVMRERNDERRKILESIIKKGSIVEPIERVDADNISEIDEFFKKSVEAGTEGIIVKKSDGPYKPGARDFNWIKYKESYDKSTLADTVDAVVMGYDVGQGKRAVFGIGDFLIGVYDPKTEKYYTVAKIGTGLTDEEWKLMKSKIENLKSKEKPEVYEVQKIMNVDVWAEPQIVVEIKADEITKSTMHTGGFALRFPRLVSWREKKPTDTTTILEIQSLFEKQRW